MIRETALGVVLLLTLTLSSCGPKEKEKEVFKDAKGGVVYGGTFRVNEVEDFRSLYPLNITEVTAHRITNQVYEGLVKFDHEDLKVHEGSGLAKSWEYDPQTMTYTFHLRKGVRFHDDACFPNGEGRELTAQDVEYCFRRLCTYSPDNQSFSLFKQRVLGADDYYAATRMGKTPDGGVRGINVIDDQTLSITLTYDYAGFLNILGQPGCWVYPEEAVEKYGAGLRKYAVGTGPFKVKLVKENEVVVLEKNPNYWERDDFGNQLPYLDRIKITFLKEKTTELAQFKKGELDMMFTLPMDMIDEVMVNLEKARKGGNPPYRLQLKDAYGVQYYGFLHESELFGDKNVRMAFNLAIDRKAIVDYALKGDGAAEVYGIVPTGFKTYRHDSLKGYSFDPARAREYLAKAGYPGGNGFPTITMELNRGGDNNVKIAELVQDMLRKNLRINVELRELTTAEYLDLTESGEALFWREAWVADYPDPENFLNLLNSGHLSDQPGQKSYLNSVRYSNPQFDSIFDVAQRERDIEERYRLYRMADQIAIDDAAIMPIYYEESTRLLQNNVQNFPLNQMEYRDFTEVYFKDVPVAEEELGYNSDDSRPDDG